MKTKQIKSIITNSEYLPSVNNKPQTIIRPSIKAKKTNTLKCKHCLSQSYEILIGKSYGKTKAWQEHSNVRNIFKFHCYECGRTYYFRPEKPDQAAKMAKNKVPFYSNSYKKKYIAPQMVKLKKLRNKKIKSDDRKLDIKYYEQCLSKHLEINRPMEIGNWLIVKDRLDQVQIFDDKSKYYRKEAHYQYLLEKRYENEQAKLN